MGGPADRPAHAWLVPAVLWLVFCAAAVGVAVLGLLSVERLRSRVEIEGVFVALVAGQAFFLVMLWPLFEERAGATSAVRDLAGVAGRLIGLLALSAPLAAVALRTAETGAGAVVRSQALVFLLGFVASLAVRRTRPERWYYPAAFVLCVVAPFAAYLLREEAGLPVGWAASLSPLWAAGAAAAGSTRAAPFVVYGLLAAGLAALQLWLPRPVAPGADGAGLGDESVDGDVVGLDGEFGE